MTIVHYLLYMIIVLVQYGTNEKMHAKIISSAGIQNSLI